MKKLVITLQIELEVPDEWAFVETSQGTQVIKIGENQFLDFIAEPILATDPEETWDAISDEAVYDNVLDKVVAEDVEMTFFPLDENID
jgi:hypothetical protein